MLAQIALVGTMGCLLAYRYCSVQATLGLLIGLVTGSIYFLYLYRQVENVQVFSKQQAIEHIRGGWIIRLGAVLLVLIVITHVFKVDALAFTAGFFTMPALLFISGLQLVVRQIRDTKKL